MDLSAGGFPDRTYVGKDTTVADVSREIERLRAVIQSMHQHYNPGAEPFDIEAAIAALPQ